MITVIVKKSAGNESVGSMWHESYQFEEDMTLQQVMDILDFGEDIIIPAKNRQHIHYRIKS